MGKLHALWFIGALTMAFTAAGVRAQTTDETTPAEADAPAGGALTGFTPGSVWPDTEGNHINAHGGGVLFHDGVYYWYGEHRDERNRSHGVRCYSSTDLYNWKNEGIVLPNSEEQGHPLEFGCIMERPKVIYNEATGKFVLWFHLELKDRGYRAAQAGVAVGDSPTGTFTFVDAKRPNAGQWPINLAEEDRADKPQEADLEWWTDPWRESVRHGRFVRRDFEGGQMSRDQTAFVDDDGTAYQIGSAEENLTLNIRELTDDYLDFTGKWAVMIPGGHNEAPAIFKHEGTYYFLASGATGWDPNAARSFKAQDIMGPWEALGNPAVGVNPQNGLGPDKTFGGQSTFILAVPGKPGAFIAMFDEWRPRNQIDSRYYWLPVTVEDGAFKVHWQDEWDLSYFDEQGEQQSARDQNDAF